MIVLLVGGDCSSVQARLKNVKALCSTVYGASLNFGVHKSEDLKELYWSHLRFTKTGVQISVSILGVASKKASSSWQMGLGI